MCEFLLGLATMPDPIAMLIGAIVSLVLELWPEWEGWPYKKASLFILFLAVPVIALVAGAEVMNCEGMSVTYASVMAAIVAGGEAFIGAVGTFHVFNKWDRVKSLLSQNHE